MAMLMTLAWHLTGVKVIFAHDTERALVAAAALVNTDGRDGEQLPDVAALATFFRVYGWTGRHERTQTELEQVRELRSRLRPLWYEKEDGIVAIVNALLRESRALPQLMKHDAEPYHLHGTSNDAPLVTRMAVEAAMGFVDVVRSGELTRLRICAYPGCPNVIIDLSRNRSKRYCDAGCGNRAAVTAYRARKAADAQV